MISIERVKEILEDIAMSDKEALEIRESLTAFIRQILDGLAKQ